MGNKAWSRVTTISMALCLLWGTAQAADNLGNIGRGNTAGFQFRWHGQTVSLTEHHINFKNPKRFVAGSSRFYLEGAFGKLMLSQRSQKISFAGVKDRAMAMELLDRMGVKHHDIDRRGHAKLSYPVKPTMMSLEGLLSNMGSGGQHSDTRAAASVSTTKIPDLYRTPPSSPAGSAALHDFVGSAAANLYNMMKKTPSTEAYNHRRSTLDILPGGY